MSNRGNDLERLRRSGIEQLGEVAWGAHICMFFSSKEESLEVIVPYFAAGLKDGEFCMWVTSPPLSVMEARGALTKAVPDLDSRLAAGQAEILDSSEWYTKQGKFNSRAIMDGWIEKLERASEKGYAGLRLCGLTTWLQAEDWDAFIKYEDEVGDLIELSEVLALCCYSLEKCDAQRVIDVVSNHHFALIKKGGRWTLVENTERARAVWETEATRAALRDSQERFALAQKAARIGSWDWNIRTGGLTWSEEIEPMFGFATGQFEGTYEAFLKCLHPDDRPKVEKAVKECIDRGTDYEIEHRIVIPDGSIRWISEKGNVIRDENDRAVRMLGIAQDVTKSKQSERRIKELNRDLARKTAELTAMNRELEAFCYSVSHDLRAPLRRIEGFGHLLKEDAKDKLGPNEQDYLARISAATANMDQLINDLLKLSHASTQGILSEKLDLAELAREVVEQLQRSEPGRTVAFEADGSFPTTGDRALLRIALTNLIGNAWKFTGKTENAKIEFGVRKLDGRTVYFVRDNGAGFDSGATEKLFRPFQRLHSASEFPGSGIGLAIVSRIVERHSGRIWAESAVGKGATFYFTLGDDAAKQS